MKRKTCVLISIIILLAVFLTACDDKKESTSENLSTKDENVIVLRLSGYPMSFTPDFQADDFAYPIQQNIFNRLCKLDTSKSEPIPDLAESWKYSDDVKTLTFYLKENAKWHDGVALTSKDVKYTFDTIKANPTYYFSPQMEIVDSIDAPDDYTVVFNLNTPDASFVSLLSWYATFILPEHIYKDIAWEDHPIGTGKEAPIGSGPFKYESHKNDESVVVVRNDDYHDGPAKLDKIIFSVIKDEDTAFQALLNGEIDALETFPTANAKEVENNPDFVFKVNEYPSPIRLIFNMKDEFAGDLAVRQAIAYAMDREEISKKAYLGYYPPEYNLYPSLIKWATNSEDRCPDKNIEKAIEVLEKAGYTKNDKGYYLTISLDYFNDLSGANDIAMLLESQLKKVGIELKLIASEYQAWDLKMQAHDFAIQMQGGFMGPDPAALKNRLSTGMASNYGQYSNAKFDELIIRGAAIADQAERAKYYKEAQKILSEDLPYIPIVGYAAPEAYWSIFMNMPIDGVGKWGWTEYTYTEKK